MLLANYVPKCQMSSGPHGPIFTLTRQFAIKLVLSKKYWPDMSWVQSLGGKILIFENYFRQLRIGLKNLMKENSIALNM